VLKEGWFPQSVITAIVSAVYDHVSETLLITDTMSFTIKVSVHGH